ncbi:MAG: DUF2892 domain-containing protein [Pseudomonadota bacterium]
MAVAKNIGQVDRGLRFALGALLVLLALTGTIGVWGYTGAVFLVTAALSFCPLYRLVGLKTCRAC